MAKFKCKLSGTIVSFDQEHDVKTMLKHPQYDLVVEEVKPSVKAEGLAVKEKTVTVKTNKD